MDALLKTLHGLVALDHLPRTGWVLRGVAAPESVAGHLVGVAHLALALAPRVDPPLDLARVLTLALVHDAPEAWSGDLPRPASRHLPPGAKEVLEAGLATEMLTPMGAHVVAAHGEYQERATREARFVRLCDQLQLGVRLAAYLEAGQRGLEEFGPGLETLDCGEFPVAAELAHELLGRIRGLLERGA